MGFNEIEDDRIKYFTMSEARDHGPDPLQPQKDPRL